MMKTILTGSLIILMGIVVGCGTKEKKSSETAGDKESNAPKTKSPRKEVTGNIGDAKVLIRWGAPSVRGRKIWGELVPYDNIWRTGADTSTYVDFSRDVKIEGQSLAKGRYSIFTIPSATEWTLIFNSVWSQWGSYEHDASKDVLRVTAKPEDLPASQEVLDFFIDKDGFGYAWEQKKIKVRVE